MDTDVPLTMNSLEISELVGSRHDNVVRTINGLVKQGVIGATPTEALRNPVSGQQMKMSIFQGVQDELHRNALADIRHMLGQLDFPTASFSAVYKAGNGRSRSLNLGNSFYR